MKDDLQRKVPAHERNHHKGIYRRITVLLLAAIVLFSTLNALTLPAISMAEDVYCGYADHQHTESCYESKLICGYEAASEQAEPQDESAAPMQESAPSHVHTEECYERVLLCEQRA